MKKIEHDIDGKIEFDILIGGKYQKRVGSGILFEKVPGGVAMLVAGSSKTMFDARIALEQHIKDMDLENEYELYKKLMSLDLENFDEAIKELDELVREMK